MMLDVLAPEARVLLLSIGMSDDTDAVAAALRETPFDWNRLMWLVEREKAVPALRRTLGNMPPGIVPPERMAQLSRISQITEFRMAHLEQLLVGALDALATEHIDVVLLKGAGLATTVYGSFPARPMYDVDLLVRADQAQRAWYALLGSGWVHNREECPPDFYHSHYHLPPLDDPQRTGLSLELHTAPTDGAIALTADMMWNDARPVTIRGRRTFVASPEHQVLHLASHFAWTHELGSAAWRTFNDLDRLISSDAIDWDVLVRAAVASRAVTSCYWTFRLARSLADVAVPEHVLQQLRPPRPEWLLTLIERHHAGALFQFSPAACPSVRMTQILWSAGMAPRWSGHGELRPWQRGEMWRMSSQPEERRSVRARLQGHARRGREWRRYLSALLNPGQVVRPRMGPAQSIAVRANDAARTTKSAAAVSD